MESLESATATTAMAQPHDSQYSIYDASASSTMDESDDAQYTEEEWRVWNQQQQQQQWPNRTTAAEARLPPQSLPPPTSLLPVASAGPSVAPPARDEQPPRAPVPASASSLPAAVPGASVDAAAMFAVCDRFLQNHAVQGPSPLMAHEGTRLSIAAGMASKHIDYLFLDRPWLQASDALGTMLCWKRLLEDPTPLPQVLWKHEAVNVACFASADSLADVMKIIQQVHRSVHVSAMRLIVLGAADRPRYDGATTLREKVPWAWVEVSKFHRPLSGTGGGSPYSLAYAYCLGFYSASFPPSTVDRIPTPPHNGHTASPALFGDVRPR